MRRSLQKIDTLDRFYVLQKLVHEYGQKDKIHPAKLTNGTVPEYLLCRKAGLIWNSKTVHGHDAYDNRMRPCELKVSLFWKDSKRRVNFNYALPKRGTKETPTDYTTRIYQHALGISGGHYWAIRKGEKILKYWKIDGEMTANFILMRVTQDLRKDIDKTDFRYNFGCTPCASCFGLHRVEHLVKNINAGNYDKAVETVASNCGK